MAVGTDARRPAVLPAEIDRILHDLRGPLNAALMHLEVVRRLVAGEPTAAHSVASIQQELERLSGMLQSAARVLALETGPRRPVDLDQVVRRAAAEAGAAVTVRPAASPTPAVVADEALLTVAVVNLLRNAVEATAAAGGDTPAPEVGVERAGESEVAVVVRDHGAGLRSTNPKVLVRLPGSPRPGHEGLGLIAAERIVRLHGGGLRFEAASPGARVLLVLPAAP
jgi:signal transduction histidine kinase